MKLCSKRCPTSGCRSSVAPTERPVEAPPWPETWQQASAHSPESHDCSLRASGKRRLPPTTRLPPLCSRTEGGSGFPPRHTTAGKTPCWDKVPRRPHRAEGHAGALVAASVRQRPIPCPSPAAPYAKRPQVRLMLRLAYSPVGLTSVHNTLLVVTEHAMVERSGRPRCRCFQASFRTSAAAAGGDQSAPPSRRARSRPCRSMIRLVGMPRTLQACAAAPCGSSRTGRPVMPCC